MIALILYLLMLSVAGAGLMQSLHGGTIGRWPGRLLDLSLGAGIALGLSSCTLFLTGLAFDGLRPWGYVAEIALLAACVAGLIRWIGGPSVFRNAGADASPIRPPGRDETLRRCLVAALALAFFALLIADLLVIIRVVGERPHGSWDAWGFWNLRARFFFGASQDWTGGALHHTQLHSDYPLLLPLSVTRIWTYLGETSTLVPQSMGMASFVALALLLLGALSTLRSGSHGLLAALVLLATGYLVELAAWQYADIPLAFFILASCVLLCMADHPNLSRNRALALAGTSAALAAWTKNEGILFLCVLGTAWALAAIPSVGLRLAGRELRQILLGALPVLIVLIGFKWAFGTPNDLLAGQNTTETLYRLFTWERYGIIASTLGGQIQALVGWLPAFLLLLAVINRPRPVGMIGRGTWVVALALSGLAIGYFFVLISTPNPLDWHLKTAGRRLLLHIWPSALFLFFMLVSTTEESAARRSPAPRNIPHA
jgi:hypothetical protein